MKPTESAEQQAVIQWWASFCKTKGLDERLLFAVPNGAHKSIQQAMKFKREGLRKGCPDLVLAVPKLAPSGISSTTRMILFYGCFIEMKRLGEKARPEQLEYADLLRKQGFNAVIAQGADEAIRAIKGYLSLYSVARTNATDPQATPQSPEA